jgi:hypothetical protein
MAISCGDAGHMRPMIWGNVAVPNHGLRLGQKRVGDLVLQIQHAIVVRLRRTFAGDRLQMLIPNRENARGSVGVSKRPMGEIDPGIDETDDHAVSPIDHVVCAIPIRYLRDRHSRFRQGVVELATKPP